MQSLANIPSPVVRPKSEVTEAIALVDVMEKYYSVTLFYLVAKEMSARLFNKMRMTLREQIRKGIG